MNSKLDQLRSLLDSEIASYTSQLPEDNLHTPIKYIMSLGGKRIRPSLVLLSANAFGGSVEKAMPAALTVEIFHNFTLVHDDIMDEAPLRRGNETVHQKWDTNTAILSGDAMVIEAYKQLALCGAERLPELLDLFNRTSAEVCLGQQYDMDFEEEEAVTEERYIEMIGLKTAVLLGCSLQMGAILANANNEECEAIYAFGKAAGIGFQLQDDYLDAFGNPENFGKQVGGDIIANKKTYLIIRALQKASDEQKRELETIYFNGKISDPVEKVERVLKVFLDLKVDRDIQDRGDEYFAEAKRQLDKTNLNQEGREQMEGFLKMLHTRSY
jgi:geranylgeranyl diphosphate synthase type II